MNIYKDDTLYFRKDFRYYARNNRKISNFFSSCIAVNSQSNETQGGVNGGITDKQLKQN